MKKIIFSMAAILLASTAMMAQVRELNVFADDNDHNYRVVDVIRTESGCTTSPTDVELSTPLVTTTSSYNKSVSSPYEFKEIKLAVDGITLDLDLANICSESTSDVVLFTEEDQFQILLHRSYSSGVANFTFENVEFE